MKYIIRADINTYDPSSLAVPYTGFEMPYPETPEKPKISLAPSPDEL